MQRLLAGPTNAQAARAGRGDAVLRRVFGVFRQPAATGAAASSERWGAAERDPFFRPGRLDCGRFAIPGFRVGNIAVLIQPARGYNIDPKATYHDPASGAAALLSRLLCVAAPTASAPTR